jgi:DNA modification methylase
LGDSYASSPAGNFGPGMPMPANGGKFRENKPKMDYKKVGLKTKDLVGIPWLVAFALRADGWYLRQDIIWSKPNPMPESVKDRCTKAHEYIFLLSKSPKYYYDYESIKEKSLTNNSGGCVGGNKYSEVDFNPQSGNEYNSNGTRNKRSVWTISTKSFSGAHFATFPPDLIEPCILAGSPRDGIVLDPFFGAGTTGIVSLKNGRNYVGIELNPEYAEMAMNRIKHGTVDIEELEIIEREKQVELF